MEGLVAESPIALRAATPLRLVRGLSRGKPLTPAAARHVLAWRIATVVAATVVLAGGCRSGIYQAASLPPQYRFPPTSAPANLDLTRLSGPAVSSTTIGPGDVLDVMLATGYEDRGIDNLIVRVDEDGTANVPLIGRVALADLEPAEAERTIATTAIEQGIFSRPNVTVLIRRKQSSRVTVVGEVNKPGVVELDRSNSDLLGALAEAGGLTEDAGVEIQVLRKRPTNLAAQPTPGSEGNIQTVSYQSGPALEPVSERINLAEVTQGGFIDYDLGDGDVVLVHRVEPRVIHVLGLVNEPRQIALPNDRDVRVLDALAEAGGGRCRSPTGFT